MTMKPETITKGGKRFVLVPLREYRKLTSTPNWPALPPADKDGNRDALAFARVTIARQLRADREKVGFSQQALADAAGVRQETVSRIESGKVTPTVAVIDKLDKAIKAATR